MADFIDWKNRVGKKVKNKITGEIRMVRSYAHEPSVTLNDGIGFCVGSLLAKEWEIYKEQDNWNLAGNLVSRNMVIGIQEDVVRVSNIKTFIKKIKEDIREDYKELGNLKIIGLENIINKRAGKL